MHKVPVRPLLILVSMLHCIGLVNCEKTEIENFLHQDQDLLELLILPENPQSTDQILVIETICGNESDAILDFKGMEIHYRRYVNSLMMMPCSPRPDTTVIGKLDAGDYQLVHWVIDRNHMITDSIVLQDTAYLHVQ